MKSLALLGLAFAATASATTIYFDDGTALETDANVYVSEDTLYRVEGTYKAGFKVSPAVPAVAGEPADDEPEVCQEGSFEYYNNPECAGYVEEEEEQVAACFPPLWMAGCEEEEEDEPEVCYEIVGTWAIEVPCES